MREDAVPGYFPELNRNQERAIAKYRANYPDLAKKFALLGASDSRIAENFGVTLQDLEAWRIVYPEFDAMLNAGRTLADAEVAEALFQKARGFSHPDVKFWLSKTKDSDGNETVEVVEKSFIAHYPPDTSAAIFWLTNRSADDWKSSTHQTHGGKVELQVTGMASMLALIKSEKDKDTQPIERDKGVVKAA